MKLIENVNGIQGLCVIEPTIYDDSRGYFMETFSKQDLNINFVQDNESMSLYGVLRGLHFQKQYPQTKLVRVVKGQVYDVAIDLRQNSQTYGQWYGIYLSEINKKQFLIPKGFAHGFLTLSENAIFCYKCDDFYHPNDEGGIIWNDKTLNIDWPIPKNMKLIISDKDQNWSAWDK